MHLIQYADDAGATRVARISADRSKAITITGFSSTYELAQAAIAAGRSLADLAAEAPAGAELDYVALLAANRVLPPLTHPDVGHCHVTGTGLTHLGSASARDKMHQLDNSEEKLTDSMRMFRWGLEGGIPKGEGPGVAPEWFYKGNGSIITAPGAAFASPDFAEDAGEEPELVGVYVIGPDGTPFRVGFAIGNEFSDHVTERKNYLYLAHSKLRVCSFGPELVVGGIPSKLEGTSRILRNGEVLWEKPFLTGEGNMCHSLANLEYHHFKYALHRIPGDVHLHYFGTATLSFADGVRTEPGDVFEVDLPDLGAPLRNPISVVPGGYKYGGVRPL